MSLFGDYQMVDLLQARRGRWGVGAFFGANGFVMGAWAPQIPLLLPRHNISEGILGLLIFGLGVGAVSAMLFSGRIIALYGSRRVATVFALAAAPMLPLIVYAPSVWALALLMALMGGMIGCMDVAMNASAVEVERRLGRAIMSSSHGFWSLGGFVGGTVGTYAIYWFGAEAQAFGTSVVALCLVLWGMVRLIDDPRNVVIGATTQPRTHLFPRDIGLWLLGAMALFSMVPEGAVLDWAAIYLGKELNSGLNNAGLAFAFFAGAMAVMRFMGDRVRSRFGAVNTLRISGAIGAAGMMLASAAPVDWLAIVGFAMTGLGVANMIPILFSAAGNHPGLPSAQAISTVTMVGYAGILVAPAPIGFVAEQIGFRLTYFTLALLLLVVAAMAERASAADILQKTAPLPGADLA
jgi:MFS family permease